MNQNADSTIEQSKRVLISYSHESDEHIARVLRLADALRSHGIDAMIDQYDPKPAEGWHKWTKRQIATSTYVLVVCTEAYKKRAEGDERDDERDGGGRGVAWESSLIQSHLYKNPQQKSRFIPVVFRAKDEDFILSELSARSWYVLDEHNFDVSLPNSGYGLLYRDITDQPRVIKPPIGRPIRLDPINLPHSQSAVVAQTGNPLPKPSIEPLYPIRSNGAVLIAEPRSDVKTYADNFTRFLRESGYEVIVPETFSIERDGRSDILSALKACILVVQVLGSDPFPRSSFLAPARYEDWLWQQARQIQKSVLRWRPPALDIEKIVELDYRELLNQDVVKCDAEDFKTTVLTDRLAQLNVTQRPSGKKLFVHHHTKDAERADEIGGAAEDLSTGINVALTNEQRDFFESIGNDPVHGLMVVYGDCGEEWIEQSLEILKKATDAASVRHNLAPPPKAIVKAKPETLPLRRRPPRWKEIAANDASALESFVRKIQGEVAT